ncbi:hypothetical protein KL909_002970 [Ogataea angusta]|nr:hypothetical protein KL909_002970 [Ogataea angusta]
MLSVAQRGNNFPDKAEPRAMERRGCAKRPVRAGQTVLRPYRASAGGGEKGALQGDQRQRADGVSAVRARKQAGQARQDGAGGAGEVFGAGIHQEPQLVYYSDRGHRRHGAEPGAELDPAQPELTI